jgi:2-polyprenyl-3-methyl-5-hydroxy-6-metoxy-1,4-benzoquinol methylase
VKHQLEKIKNCPLCNSDNLDLHIKAVDHNFSLDEFTIVNCKNCSFKFTNPRPTEESIYKYYKSENYISHTSSNKGLFNKVYLRVRSYQFGRKLKIINSEIENKGGLLDVGCGTGDFLNYCKGAGWNVTGLETDDMARNFALSENKVNVLKSLDEVIHSKKKFDVITLWHVLEHVYKIDDYIKKLKSLLNDNGILILGLPNNCSYDAKYYNKSWYAYDPPIHVSHFNIKNINDIKEKYHFKELKVHPLIFDAYYISMLSEKKMGGKILRGIIKGWQSNRKAKSNGQYSSLMYVIRS